MLQPLGLQSQTSLEVQNLRSVQYIHCQTSNGSNLSNSENMPRRNFEKIVIIRSIRRRRDDCKTGTWEPVQDRMFKRFKAALNVINVSVQCCAMWAKGICKDFFDYAKHLPLRRAICEIHRIPESDITPRPAERIQVNSGGPATCPTCAACTTATRQLVDEVKHGNAGEGDDSSIWRAKQTIPHHMKTVRVEGPHI